jgi:uncharacterized protein YcbX
MATRTGIVHALWRWPVKGMTGERMMSVRVDGRGVGGDRTHAVLTPGDGAWTPLSAREHSALEHWVAAYPFNYGANVDPASPPHTLVISPQERTYVWNDPLLRSALEKDLGRPVQLTRDIGGQQVVERTVLVTWGETDAREVRSNLHLDTDLDPDWGAGVLTFEGGVRMRIVEPCRRGGLYARVITRGRVAVGARVHVSGFGTRTSGSAAFGR